MYEQVRLNDFVAELLAKLMGLDPIILCEIYHSAGSVPALPTSCLVVEYFR